MDDIFTQCREGNAVAVRLWLDNTENDLNQGWVIYQHLFLHKHFCVRCWIARTRILIHLLSVSSLKIMHVGRSLWPAIRKPCLYWTHSSTLKYDITSKCWTAQPLFYSVIHKWCSCLVESFDGFRYGQLILLHLFFANPLWCYDPWVVCIQLVPHNWIGENFQECTDTHHIIPCTMRGHGCVLVYSYIKSRWVTLLGNCAVIVFLLMWLLSRVVCCWTPSQPDSPTL